MTKPFNQEYHCPNCKTWQRQETSFSRWIRNNPDLKSGDGYAVTDSDYWIHRYKTFGRRRFQLMVGVEIKTMGANLSMSQRDTLVILNALLRNRRATPTSEMQWQAGTGITKHKSLVTGEELYLKAFGIHTLRFSGLGPDDSEWIKWDKRDIDPDTLTRLLAFDLDPDTLRPLDLRSHHLTHENQTLKLEL